MQWKALPKEVKDRYEERARVMAMDATIKKISETSDAAPSASDSRSVSPHPGTHLTPSGMLQALFIYSVRAFCYGRHICRLSSVCPMSDLGN